MSGTVRLELTINGTRREFEVAPWTTLLDLLRENLDLTGTKKGCDHGQCGACTVLVGGKRINSCLALAVTRPGSEVTTIEGLARGDELHPLQAAFLQHDVFQCGFCTPGQICSGCRPDQGRSCANPRRNPRGDERKPVPLRGLPEHYGRHSRRH